MRYGEDGFSEWIFEEQMQKDFVLVVSDGKHPVTGAGYNRTKMRVSRKGSIYTLKLGGTTKMFIVPTVSKDTAGFIFY